MIVSAGSSSANRTDSTPPVNRFITREWSAAATLVREPGRQPAEQKGRHAMTEVIALSTDEVDEEEEEAEEQEGEGEKISDSATGDAEVSG
jgi:hypothetical protein